MFVDHRIDKYSNIVDFFVPGYQHTRKRDGDVVEWK